MFPIEDNPIYTPSDEAMNELKKIQDRTQRLSVIENFVTLPLNESQTLVKYRSLKPCEYEFKTVNTDYKVIFTREEENGKEIYVFSTASDELNRLLKKHADYGVLFFLMSIEDISPEPTDSSISILKNMLGIK